MGTLLHDLRYSFRMLWKSPGFAVVAIVTLALGIGANTAVFSVVNGVLLRPLPYRDSDRLLAMRGNLSRLDMDDFKERSQTLDEGGAVTIQAMDFTGGAEPLRVEAGLVSAGLFPVLGREPGMGRALTAEEDRLSGPRVVVLSHAFWQQSLGADPAIIGKTIPLSGQSYTVVGVMPADFELPRGQADLFASLRVVYPEGAAYRGVHFMRSYWRLKAGVTVAQAEAEMSSIDGALEQLHPAEDKGRHTELVPLQEWVVGKTRPR